MTAAAGLVAADTATGVVAPDGHARGRASAAPRRPVTVSRSAASAPSRAVLRQARALVAAHQVGADELSRSSSRPPLAQVERTTKTAALPVAQQDLGGARRGSVTPSPQEIALSLLPSYGWDSSQFSCLDEIWTRESNWDPYAENSSSGAYGIPQALPGSKMSASGSDWQTNPATQIRWGLSYIRASYGSPCGAWYFWESHSWY